MLRSQPVGAQIGDEPANKGVAGHVEEGTRYRWETAMGKEKRGGKERWGMPKGKDKWI